MTENGPPLAHDTPTPHRSGRVIREIVQFALIAFLIVVPVRLFIAQPFIVQGASMQPTFDTGQYLIVDQLSYRFEKPARGEIIIFRHPDSPSTFLIKRIVGLPGETVRLAGNTVTIADDEHPDGFVMNEPYLSAPYRESAPLTIELADNEYFVMGDNRRASSDSRVWGPLEDRFIVGKAFLRLLPITATDLLPGDYSTTAP